MSELSNAFLAAAELLERREWPCICYALFVPSYTVIVNEQDEKIGESTEGIRSAIDDMVRRKEQRGEG